MNLQENNPRPIKERILQLLFIISVMAILYIASVASVYYKLPPADYIIKQFDTGELWWHMHLKNERRQRFEANPVIYRAFAAGDANVTWVPTQAYDGYNLIVSNHSNSVALADMKGNPVYFWDTDFNKIWPDHKQSTVNYTHAYVSKAQVFPNGDLLAVYTGTDDTPYGYGLAKLDKNSQVLWTYDEHAHHDFYIDKTNGNIYALIQDFIQELPENFKALSPPSLVDSIVILSPEGKELKRISILDAFKDTPYELLPYSQSLQGQNWDILHTNSIMKLEPELAKKFPMMKAGQILISMNTVNIIAAVDPGTGKIAWATKGVWHAQHSASFLSNGHILLFDNRGHSINNNYFSRVIEFDPKSQAVVWHYDGAPENRFFTWLSGMSQRLPNGNSLAVSSFQGRAFEVTPDHHVVWNFQLSNKNRTSIGDRSAKNTLAAPRPLLDSLIRYSAADLPFLKH